jgi:hypothetical protein
MKTFRRIWRCPELKVEELKIQDIGSKIEDVDQTDPLSSTVTQGLNSGQFRASQELQRGTTTG